MQKTHYQTNLYNSKNEKDSCGIGFIANSKGIRSHEIVSQALTALKNMAHRGAQGCDPCTGDGAGILIQIPHEFFNRVNSDLSQYLGYGVGMFFLPRKPQLSRAIRINFEAIARERNISILGWRRVPVNQSALGDGARSTEPEIWQVFVYPRGEGVRDNEKDSEKFERQLYILRKIAEKRLRKYSSFLNPRTGKVVTQFYIASLSCKTLVYKGLLLPKQLDQFYPDLVEPDFTTAVAMVHSRFSTNTFPSWELAHPYRLICHNGEINTIRGNLNWMKARQGTLSGENAGRFGSDIDQIFPLVEEGQSDSASLDNVVDFLVRGGRSLSQAMMMLIPEPWTGNLQMDPDRRGFYEFHSAIMEPWDGPAAVCFTDGRFVGAILDRNGLRPCRFQILDDETVILASETGVVPVAPERIISKGRLAPGQMLLIDLQEGKILSDEAIKKEIVQKYPYQTWVSQSSIHLTDLPKSQGQTPLNRRSIIQLLRVFNYSQEEVDRVLLPMATQGEEPTSSMGNDTPLAVLSERPQILFKYFRQLFAQVTNPPIDSIREKFVMSLSVSLGPKPGLFLEKPDSVRRINLSQPILSPPEMMKIKGLSNHPHLKGITLPILFDSKAGAKGFEKSLKKLYRNASAAVKNGYQLIILSDRGVDSIWAPLPSLLALSAVHQELIQKSQRTRVALVLETGEARDVHHFACLLGYGADSIHPYLAIETVMDHFRRQNPLNETSPLQACNNYIQAINQGLLKIMSKMGISTIQSYCGAQIFEAIGLSEEVIERYFQGTASRLSGLDLKGIARETSSRHEFAYQSKFMTELEPGGEIHYRTQDEVHFWNPETISKLQHATRNNDTRSYKAFSEQVARDSCFTLRGLLQLKPQSMSLPLDEVEPAAHIVRRFTTGAMSFGALSKEAHETLAIAMNQMGAKSNSGEGGEDSERFEAVTTGNSTFSKNSAIKQIASARFGVTTHYLMNASELQIKVTQGAKPGEGGQLPGYKVDEMIARLRHSTPGVQLISPPPHHDIYSIEDLAQLIFDLKNVNPQAEVSVKLVSEVGIGTVAAGVVKAYADKIVISGDSGGTGASPLSSIKYAGIPWEIGLAETNQTLLLNGLRNRVRLETDGQLKTGRDVIIGALLGAEEFGFSTAPLVVQGCIMMRKCHLNTCPVGVATQDPVLRKKFAGQPEHLINYFFFVAEEVRALMAQLGVRTFKELIGRSDLLQVDHTQAHWKAKTLDLSLLLNRVNGRISNLEKTSLLTPFNIKLVDLAQDGLKYRTPVRIELPIQNTDRTVGAFLSNQIVAKYGPKGLPPDTIEIDFKGSAGQSFGAFLVPGVSLRLEGDANDYVGKGLSGGKIVIFPPRLSKVPESSILIGNTCLYGATSGGLFLAGAAGERFAVRNSGAVAVVEGVGDHGCEYMTGGIVIILGPTGKNFAAGMSGGLAYILDDDGLLKSKCNLAMVKLEDVSAPEEESFLFSLIRTHNQETKSQKAQRCIQDWPRIFGKFKKVVPIEYKKAIEKQYLFNKSHQKSSLGVNFPA